MILYWEGQAGFHVKRMPASVFESPPFLKMIIHFSIPINTFSHRKKHFQLFRKSAFFLQRETEQAQPFTLISRIALFF
ncbi:hypothetical protein D3H55_21135 [Bacillus salacetis]|uniref:Uncharacterized protein n=1 Tax=Bacillus salacetis TaxID=2315464 RepID=A0A3A1QNN6_9BACI|nr:hypothetical protein D3H55_21135 [Bacillus salacetis]